VLGDSPAVGCTSRWSRAKKAASIGAFDLQLHDPGEALFFAEVRKENSLDVARDTMVQTIEELATRAPTPKRWTGTHLTAENIELTLNSSDQVGSK